MSENPSNSNTPGEQPGGCRIALLSSGKRVLSSEEPLSGGGLFHRPENALLIALLIEGRLAIMVEGAGEIVLNGRQFCIYRSQRLFSRWRLRMEAARFVIVEGRPHAASVCPLGTGDRDVPACLCCPNYRQASKTLIAPLPETIVPAVVELMRFEPRTFCEHLHMEARLLVVIGNLVVDTAAPALPASATECPFWLQPEDRRHIEDVAAHLRKYPGEDHSLSGLSQRFYLNEFKLKAGFKQVYGETVFRHLRRLRMERARGLIESGALTVTEIALEVGYSNPSQFSSAFSAQWGVKPKQYQLCCRLRPQPPSTPPGEA